MLGEFSSVRRKNAIRWLANIYEKYETTRFDGVLLAFCNEFRSNKTHLTWVSIHSIRCFRFQFFPSLFLCVCVCVCHTTNRTYWFAIDPVMSVALPSPSQHEKPSKRSMHFSQNLIYLLLTLDVSRKIARVLLCIMAIIHRFRRYFVISAE